MSRVPRYRSLALALFASVSLANGLSAQVRAPELLLRLDDVGMNHSVNTAIARVAATGMPFSVSVMFACPWYQEAVELMKKNPQIAVGVHLVLNSEWRNYRWGPVLGKAGVPSLVDGDGYFLPSTTEFVAHKYDLGEVERELSAQMDRAVASGLKIAYIDHHMGTAVATPELRIVLERVAKKYNVGISRYFGESYHTMFDTPIAQKKTAFLDMIAKADPARVNLFVVHSAVQTAEMEVLFDRNNAAQNASDGVPLVARHRQAELNMVLSPEFAQLVRSGRVKLITYQQLSDRMGGPSGMKRPQ
ncbi:MAG: ChbG/HpnK family deacetylase [bacterium]